ncbi:MFS transporter [Chondromyces crocatus]|uniref:MFS transporter n=1 Tax=Chondromyces crocatus TaxID=52 RepID=UPI0012E116A0|nr:MFS transporter [Chondromyces crocatus]
MTTSSRRFRFALLFGLAMTEMMPIALISQALPLFLRRSGASLQAIGLISLVLLPRALKVFWAPFVDRIGASSRFGRYRLWLLCLHGLLVVSLALGAFTDVEAWLTTKLTFGIPALLWLSILSATADTASHALAVNLLAPDERGSGNGVQTAGMMLGSLVGGGALVMLVEQTSWKLALLLMAGAILLPLPAVLLYQEPPLASAQHVTAREIFAFFKRPRLGRWLLFLGLMAIGPSTIDICLPSLLVDRGYALSEIGLVMGVITSLAGAAGGAFGGVLIKHLGRERAFYALTLLCSACLASTLLTRMAPGRALLYAGLALPYFGVVARAPLLYAMIMDRSRGHVASSDYTVQFTLVQISGFLGLGLGGVIAEQLGMTAAFVTAPLLTLGTLVAAKYLVAPQDFQPDPETATSDADTALSRGSSALTPADS